MHIMNIPEAINAVAARRFLTIGEVVPDNNIIKQLLSDTITYG